MAVVAVTTATICERWDIELPDPTPGEPWFLDWALRSPKQAGIHLTAGLLAYRSLAPIKVKSAREYFGGIGAQALMIDEIWQPNNHTVLDYSASAVKHLDSLRLNAYQADSYLPENTARADLVGLDFGDLTIWKMVEGPRADLLDRVFLLEPKAVVLTDVAGPYLHLHRERYETVLGKGTCVDYPSYLEALARYIDERWGYALVAGFYHRWSTVMSLTPGAEHGSFKPTPSSPVGLVLS